jgi:hypothetical protein
MRAAGENALLIAYRNNPQWEEAKDMAEDLDPAHVYCDMVEAAAPDQRRSRI